MERFIVIVHDPDNHTWYAPVVEAPGEREALDAAEDNYTGCTPVCALDVLDVEHIFNVLREHEGQPCITWWMKRLPDQDECRNCEDGTRYDHDPQKCPLATADKYGMCVHRT